MSEYFVTFFTKVTAKSESDLNRKAEKISEQLSKCLRKTVQAHGYVEVEKQDKIKK